MLFSKMIYSCVYKNDVIRRKRRKNKQSNKKKKKKKKVTKPTKVRGTVMKARLIEKERE